MGAKKAPLSEKPDSGAPYVIRVYRRLSFNLRETNTVFDLTYRTIFIMGPLWIG